MKKRHKAMITIGTGILVYSIGIMMGVSFLSNDSQKTEQSVATSKPSYVPVETPETLSKWVSDIHPSAGASEQ